MIRLIESPLMIPAAGNKPKTIEEFVGRMRTGQASISIARMLSPAGWTEPGQTPDFDEFSVVLHGVLRVESHDGTVDVRAGQAVHAPAGDWVRYSTPADAGAEYLAICLPAFSPATVHRDPA
ncbi:MAG: cupin domain-containing protein [Candidatus Binatia bacterium]